MHFGKNEVATYQSPTRYFKGWNRALGSLRLAFVAILLFMTGCTMVGPDFVKPTAPVLEAWTETQVPGLGAGETDYSKWWRAFEDPVLDNLVEKAYRQNLSLQIAGIRIYEARAQLGIAIGTLYPQQQSVSGGFCKQQAEYGWRNPFYRREF